MNRLIITFGIIAGLIVATMLIITTLIYHSSGNIEGGAIYGYSSMLVAFSLIFVGIKKYRDQHGEGFISFGKGFKIGLFITLIASTIYVITWLIDYYYFMPDFMEKYSAQIIEKMQKDGVPQAEIDEQVKEMDDFGELYKNPFFNALITYVEILPVGLLISLISATILKKKNQ